MTEKAENDVVILKLKEQIKEKKKLLETTKRFQPVTNCSIDIDGIRLNIQVLSKEQLINLLVKLNIYKMSAKELELLNEFSISGFTVEDWMRDVQSKLMNLNRRDEESKLVVMENRLHNLLSGEKKVELEIEEIANMLK